MRGEDGQLSFVDGPRNAAGQPEGVGIWYYADGDRYEGNFKGGKFEGDGRYYLGKVRRPRF